MSVLSRIPISLGADISENELWNIDKKMFQLLLIDHTLQDYNQRLAKNAEVEGIDYVDIPHNILWATSDYEELGKL